MKILSAFRYHFITNSLSIIVWFSTQKSLWFFRARLIFTRSFSLLFFSISTPLCLGWWCRSFVQLRKVNLNRSRRERYCVFHNLNGSDYTCSESPIMAHFHFYAIFFFSLTTGLGWLFVCTWAGLLRTLRYWTCNYTRHLASNDIDVDLRFLPNACIVWTC